MIFSNMKKGTLALALLICAISIQSKFLKIEEIQNLINSYNSLNSTNNEDALIGSVIYNHQKGTYEVKVGQIIDNAPAYATYTKGGSKTGWDYLSLSSYQGEIELYTDETKSYAMGYLEGYLTADKIWDHYTNMRHYYYFENNFVMKDTVKKFLNWNLNWMRTTAVNNRNTDPYWYHVYTIIRQLEGLIAGYNSVVDKSKQISYEEFQVMNANGDIDEVGLWGNVTRPDFQNMPTKDILDYINEYSRCSALMKIAADYSDVWVGHNTWTSFSSMIRIFKEYRFKSNYKTEKSRTVTFSGYPGTLSSIDDFYVTDRDLYVTETTNPVFNSELYDKLTPQSLLTWIRTMLANRLSENGKDWISIFAKFNSGTYNNQFQILDMKLINFTKGEINDTNVLWIIEQIPGYTESADVTDIFKFGYWASYNTPYFQNIRSQAGFDDILKKKPELKDAIDYDSCARANIFRRDQSKVNSLEAFKKLMRYNDYKNDVLSKGNPSFSIACRGDFAEDPECKGAIDAKVASVKELQGTSQKKIYIISGPTTDNQTPFDSSTSACSKKSKYMFQGLPTVFNYNWTDYNATLFDE